MPQTTNPCSKGSGELRFLQKKSMQEIAEYKNASVRTVYNLLHRGITQLRKEINEKNFLWLW
ncbi:sigma-70 family RNA polymerase sigma factor [Pedobacter frigidisoli]|uniref:Sigma-70 family RNA polymerase sigma factor n=1 Tax=Pedobacter frigidisoli TaxID=2530455 RepID=A0A4R0NYX1_9SPHI|nr:sigma-70 family RNA polymerase sigma factor [Pedobacter frigidisoli]